MSKPANKKSGDYADRIPTLTEIVALPNPPSAAVPLPAATPSPPKELPKDLAVTVERMVYKALYRQLAPLSKEISADIMSILEKQLLDKKSR